MRLFILFTFLLVFRIAFFSEAPERLIPENPVPNAAICNIPNANPAEFLDERLDSLMCYFTNPAEAMKFARKENAPIMLIGEANSMWGCRKWERLLREEDFARYAKWNFVPLMLIMDSWQPLEAPIKITYGEKDSIKLTTYGDYALAKAQAAQRTIIPALVILDEFGVQVAHLDREELGTEEIGAVPFLKNALAKYRSGVREAGYWDFSDWPSKKGGIYE